MRSVAQLNFAALCCRLALLGAVTALAAAPVQAIEFNVNDQTSFANAMQAMAQTTGANYTINITGSFTMSGAVAPVILDDGQTLTVKGNGHTIDGASQYRPFFISSSTPTTAGGPTVTISDLTIANGAGNGGSGAGGGMGAGGGLFVDQNATVILDDVSFAGNAANGGDAATSDVGGGGGLGGSGGASVVGGGGGLYGPGGANPSGGIDPGAGGGGGGALGIGGPGSSTGGGGGGGFFGVGGATSGGGSAGGGGGGGGGFGGGSGGGYGNVGGGGGGGTTDSGGNGGVTFGAGAGGTGADGQGGDGGSYEEAGLNAPGVGGGGGGGGEGNSSCVFCGSNAGGAGNTFGGGGGGGYSGSTDNSGGPGGFGGGGGGSGADAGSAMTSNGGDGGYFGGGGGADEVAAAQAGNGGDFGGGGGGYESGGGNGGYGGGGGASLADQAGNGGFGGGGGTTLSGTAGAGGFGGGDGVAGGGGGGGAGFGGAVFVRDGGTLIIRGSGSVGGGAVTGGSGADGGGDGQAAGSGIYLQNATVTFDAEAGHTQTISDDIADDTGNGGDSGSLRKTGAGTLRLSGSNTFSGGITVAEGTLSLGSNAAAGTGTITTTGSVIDYANGVSIGNAININSDTTQLRVASGTATQLGVISETSGPRPLEKTGAGTLVLSGTNTFTGLLSVSAGTLDVRNGAAIADTVSISVASGAALAITDSETIGALAGEGTVTIASGQTLTTGGNGESTLVSGAISGDGALAKAGSGTMALAGTNTYAGGTTISDGTLQLGIGGSAGSILGDITNNATLAFFHSGSHAYHDVISGTGDVYVLGAGTLTLSGANTYTGDTTVASGMLVVNGSIDSSAVTVGRGGALGGTGSTGALTVNAGGIHAPGNSIGRQTVNGNYTLSPASIFFIEANAAGQSDKVVVRGGSVTVSDALLAVHADFGDYSTATNYTIIDNDGTDPVTGTFATVQVNSLFLDPAIDYAGGDGNDVVLSLVRNELKMIDLAETPNERAVAYALDQFPTENPIFEQVFAFDGNTARSAYNALTGEAHATLLGVVANQSLFVRETVLSRLVQAYHGGGAGGAVKAAALASGGPTTVATLGDASMMGLGMQGDAATGHDAPASLPAYGSGLTFWTQGYGAWGSVDGDANAATVKRTLGGFLSGVDAALAHDWRAGLATGYARTNVSVDARLSAAQVDSYNLIGYGGGALGALALRAAGAWTWHQIDSARTVAFPGFVESEQADYTGDTGQVFGEAALPMVLGRAAMEPFAGGAYVHVRTGGFVESGTAAGLNSSGSSDDLAYTTLGVRAAMPLPPAGVQVVSRVSLAWQHAFGNLTPQMALAFNQYGIGMGITGVPIARDTALIEAGIDVTLGPETMLSLSYQGQLADGVEDNGLRGSLDWQF